MSAAASSSVSRVPRRSKLIEVPRGIIDGAVDENKFDEDEHEFDNDAEAMGQAIDYIEANVIVWDLCNGDVVQFMDIGGGYRNCGKLIWFDNECHTLPSEEYDEYGYVPPHIKINQFKRADFFKNTIDHNAYIWHDHVNYPEISETELPDTASDDYTGLRLIEFRKGWSLVTNCDDIMDRPYEYCSQSNINLPPHINRRKVMYLIDEDTEGENSED